MERSYIISKEENRYVYRRGDKSVVAPSDLKIEDLPILSINENVTEFFGVVLDPPVYVGVDSSVKFYVKIPLDIGVYITDGRNYKLIDKIEIHPKKYALYGDVAKGKIYRYWKTNPLLNPFLTEKHEAILAIEAINKAESIGAISKVIFDSKHFSLFKKDNMICGELIQLQRLQKGLALVKLMNKPSLEGFSRMPHVKADRLTTTFEMSFGT